MTRRNDSYKPRTRPELAERIIEGEALIVNANRGEIVVLNEAGAVIWPLLDGTNDVASMVARLRDVFEVDEDTARRDVEDFLDALEARGALAD